MKFRKIAKQIQHQKNQQNVVQTLTYTFLLGES